MKVELLALSRAGVLCSWRREFETTAHDRYVFPVSLDNQSQRAVATCGHRCIFVLMTWAYISSQLEPKYHISTCGRGFFFPSTSFQNVLFSITLQWIKFAARSRVNCQWIETLLKSYRKCRPLLLFKIINELCYSLWTFALNFFLVEFCVELELYIWWCSLGAIISNSSHTLGQFRSFWIWISKWIPLCWWQVSKLAFCLRMPDMNFTRFRLSFANKLGAVW